MDVVKVATTVSGALKKKEEKKKKKRKREKKKKKKKKGRRRRRRREAAAKFGLQLQHVFAITHQKSTSIFLEMLEIPDGKEMQRCLE